MSTKKATKAPRKRTEPAAKKPGAKGAAKKPAAKAVKKAAAKKPAAKKAAAKKPAAKESAKGARLEVGAPAPAFELPDQDGRTVSSEQLGGAPYVLYFYPKDDTPGCTREACGFRDAGRTFRKAGVRVIGVSPDTAASHRKFADKFSLDFTLLSDGDRVLARAYGVWTLKKNYGREYMGVERSTFVVGADGTIRAAWRGVKVDGHVDEVLQAARSLR
jgi:thioredoxin-dependent peroxiredoxin